MAAGAGPVDAERAVAVAFRDATLGSPQDRLVEGVGLRYIAERAVQ